MQYGLLIHGRPGSRKTTLARRLLEATHGQIQHIVLDPEGEFYTLREKFDYVLVAQAGGDVVADLGHTKTLHQREQYGKRPARRLLAVGVSAVIDLYELEHADRDRFVKWFCEALVEAPR